MYLAASHAPQPKAKPHGKRTLTFFHPPIDRPRAVARSLSVNGAPIRNRPFGSSASPLGSVCRYHNIASTRLRCCVRPSAPRLGLRPSPGETTTALRASAAATLSTVLRAEARSSSKPKFRLLAGKIFVLAPSFSEASPRFRPQHRAEGGSPKFSQAEGFSSPKGPP